MGEESFYMIDGSVLRDLNDLVSAFDRMSDDTFYYHVSQDKNDFANWVGCVLGESELARNMSLVGTRHEVHIELLKFLLRKEKSNGN